MNDDRFYVEITRHQQFSWIPLDRVSQFERRYDHAHILLDGSNVGYYESALLFDDFVSVAVENASFFKAIFISRFGEGKDFYNNPKHIDMVSKIEPKNYGIPIEFVGNAAVKMAHSNEEYYTYIPFADFCDLYFKRSMEVAAEYRLKY